MRNKWSANLIPFGTAHDRFCPSGYCPVISTKEKIQLAKKINWFGYDRVAFPCHV
jgi:hypothetical protein